MEQISFKKSLARVFLGVIVCLLLSFPSFAEELTGKIVAIADGDTVTLLTPQMEEIKIRLAAIDAPEKDQPFGQKSKQMLSDLIFNRQVRLDAIDTDKYGRTVGHIYLADSDINMLMVSQGGAWAYRQYLGPNDSAFIQAEESARNDKAGLWALQEDQIMPPWEWRHKDPSQDPTACTMEAKQCPDGSYVSRTGANCAFAACPGSSPTRVITPVSPPQSSSPSLQAPAGGKTCCRHCTKGIPCGNSCISASRTCRQPPGCAC
jgi:endonuclease YncB( thermonuclease family)